MRSVGRLSLLAVIVFLAGTAWVVSAYGALSFFPTFVGEFGASLAAFLLALSWDRELEKRQVERAAQSLKDDRLREAKELDSRLSTDTHRLSISRLVKEGKPQQAQRSWACFRRSQKALAAHLEQRRRDVLV